MSWHPLGVGLVLHGCLSNILPWVRNLEHFAVVIDDLRKYSSSLLSEFEGDIFM